MIVLKRYFNKYILTMATKRFYTSQINLNKKDNSKSDNFETVFTFNFIKQLAIFSRLKVYQIVATTIAIPGCGILETLNILPNQSYLVAAYIGWVTFKIQNFISYKNVDIY